jgi:exosortase
MGSLLFLLILYPVNITMLKFMYGKPLIMIATIGAAVLFLGGWKLLKYTWLPVAYLFFAVPLPQQLYFQITNPMRKLAAFIATGILNLVPQLDATVQGSTIEVLYKNVRLEPGLDVADACSGIRLLMAFAALGVAMAYLHWRPDLAASGPAGQHNSHRHFMQYHSRHHYGINLCFGRSSIRAGHLS